MKVLLFFVVVIALGSANPIGPTTIFGPSRDDRIKTAIDNNVQWLLSGITNGNLEDSDLARAVVAVFLAEPGYFSVGHEIGRQLKSNVTLSLLSRIILQQGPSNIPTEELALYVQALTVSCHDPRSPRRFFGHDLTNALWKSGIRSQRTDRFPANAFLALCNADATHHLVDLRFSTPFTSIHLTDEEAFTLMAIDCFESHFPWNLPTLQGMIRKSGYQYYPSNLTVEKLLELMNPDDSNTTPLFAIGAAMQTLMYIHSLGVSDLPLAAVDFLVDNQDEDGSWGQSALNSFFILPVLSGKSFRNINKNHCPPTQEEEKEPATYPDRDLFADESRELRSYHEMKLVIQLRDDSPILYRDYSNSLYDLLSNDPAQRAIYQNGTDGKPYLTSLRGKKNRPEAGYFWNTYEIALNPNGTLTRLPQSHADIKVKRNYRYVLWFYHTSAQEDRS